MFPADEDLLSNPAYAALSGPHARFAEASGRALRYPADVAPFLGLPTEPAERDWRDAAELVPPGTQAAIIRGSVPIPQAWQRTRSFEVVQLIGEHVNGIDEPEAISLGLPDVSEMLALVRETNPGPFLTRTVELGDYVGIRRGDQLLAMAGERLHLEGWTEISAVCTAPNHRRQGLASRVVNALIAGIERRSERAFMHVLATNTSAIRLYEALGFRPRRCLTITAMTPEAAPRR
jgi:ribosomal protein S18 acetylase RimI-like enzyme